jgi:hypothetical protein
MAHSFDIGTREGRVNQIITIANIVFHNTGQDTGVFLDDANVTFSQGTPRAEAEGSVEGMQRVLDFLRAKHKDIIIKKIDG